MPIPFILAGVALVAGGYGVKKGVDAKRDFSEASDTNDNANSLVNRAQKSLEATRDQTQLQIEDLGKAKLLAYESGLIPFVNAFSKLQNVDFKECKIDGEFAFSEAALAELTASAGYMSPLLLSGISSVGAGGLAGLAAFGGAGLFAAASTGTPIAALSGVAATNATLAWFGGGALSAGGLGMAGGTAVLGGIVAGPVLAVGGMILASKAESAKHAAYENLAKAKIAAEEMKSAETVAEGIFTAFLHVNDVIAQLMERFVPLLSVVQNAVASNTDYRRHPEHIRKGIMMAAATASTIRKIIDKPLLSESGTVIEKSVLQIDHLHTEIVEELS
ncbi:hypothetical protein [Pseudomonas fluorescens]|uniref:Chemotaxis protein n=1 Tax=Pseudomonas fluorescens TaxID=294 RepID=A0A0F4V4R9_PSEFL|nr:hypothetical protein [Pseudomonas fluorescens]KJZ63739.1 hypothetical protein VD17_21615 [Pseudomonas fluorescens]